MKSRLLRLSSLSLASVAMAMLFVACGGGGGGGGGSASEGGGASSGGSNGISYTSGSVSMSFPANVPQSFVLTATPANATEFSAPANAATLTTKIQDNGTGLLQFGAAGAPYATVANSVNSIEESSGRNGFFSEYFVTGNALNVTAGILPLAPGIYQGNFQLVACTGTNCTTPLDGSPWNFPYSFQVTAASTATTLAGNGNLIDLDGPGSQASFNQISALVLGNAGNLFVADRGNKIRIVTPSGVVSTFVGSGATGAANGPALTASFNRIGGLAIDSAGNLYVADAGNNMIRRVTPQGVVSTFAGSGQAGSADGAGALASFNEPVAVAVDASGNVYVADSGNHRVRHIAPDGTVSTLITSSGIGPGSTTAPYFDTLTDLCVDPSGNIYTLDYASGWIFKISPSGQASALAGMGRWGGSTDGLAAQSTFNNPIGIASDPSGNLYVADGGSLVRKITPGGIVTTLISSNIYLPSAVAVDASGTVYVANSLGVYMNGSQIIPISSDPNQNRIGKFVF